MAKNRLLGGMEGAFSHDMKDIVNHNFSDVSFCTTELDVTSSTTLTNIPGLVTDVLDIGTYKFSIKLPTVCTANNGSKFAFKQSVASMLSAAQYNAIAYTASGLAVSKGTTTTDQTLLLDNASAVVIYAEITGVVTVAVAGTLQLQAAEHSSHADTFSVFLNAQMQFERVTTG